MPELPEVETVRLGMSPYLTGKIISGVKTYRKDLRVPFPQDLSQLVGGKIIALTRRAKYILVHIELRQGGREILVLHLGMSGRITTIADISSYSRVKHDHFILQCSDGTGFVFNDPRRFGVVIKMKEGEVETHPSFKDLGPEPLEDSFTGEALLARLAKKSVALKVGLLDQKNVVGVGNIYASEALYDAKLSPLMPCKDLTKPQAQSLVKSIKKILSSAIKAGGSSLKDYRTADGSLGYFQYGFKVYDRGGEPCPRCASNGKKKLAIQKITQAGRSTYYCAQCQTS